MNEIAWEWFVKIGTSGMTVYVIINCINWFTKRKINTLHLEKRQATTLDAVIATLEAVILIAEYTKPEEKESKILEIKAIVDKLRNDNIIKIPKRKMKMDELIVALGKANANQKKWIENRIRKLKIKQLKKGEVIIDDNKN